MTAASLLLAFELISSATGENPNLCPKRVDLGEFGCLGAVSARTAVPQAPVVYLVNPGLARTADGHWLRWRIQWEGQRISGVEAFERVSQDGDLRGWNVPTTTRKIDAPNALEGEKGCRLVEAVLAGGRRLGAWNCATTPGTILATPSPSGGYKVVARLPAYFQAMSSTAVEHGHGNRITLVRYDIASQSFELIDLAW